MPDAAIQVAETPAARAIALRIAGKGYPEIAADLGISPKQARGLLARNVARLTLESAPEIRALEALRIDEMLAKLWPWAMGHYTRPLFDDEGNPTGQYVEYDGPPDVKAVDRIIALMKRRAELQGLDAPREVEHTVAPAKKGKSSGEAQRDLAATLQALLSAEAIPLDDYPAHPVAEGVELLLTEPEDQ